MAFSDYVDPNGEINDTDRIEYWQEHLSALAGGHERRR